VLGARGRRVEDVGRVEESEEVCEAVKRESMDWAFSAFRAMMVVLGERGLRS
jgi:hypothetical protein